VAVAEDGADRQHPSGRHSRGGRVQDVRVTRTSVLPARTCAILNVRRDGHFTRQLLRRYIRVNITSFNEAAIAERLARPVLELSPWLLNWLTRNQFSSWGGAMATVTFTPEIQSHLPCLPRVVFGQTVREVLEAYFEWHGRARHYILDERGCLRPRLAVFVDGVVAPSNSAQRSRTPECQGVHLRPTAMPGDGLKCKMAEAI
jgi:hypothetical protein